MQSAALRRNDLREDHGIACRPRSKPGRYAISARETGAGLALGWKNSQPHFGSDRLVFIDETSARTNMPVPMDGPRAANVRAWLAASAPAGLRRFPFGVVSVPIAGRLQPADGIPYTDDQE